MNVAKTAMMWEGGGSQHEREKVVISIGRNVSLGLKDIYKNKILPIEEASQYQVFRSEPIHDAEFFAKPMVLVVGQYSVGKTSFIRSLVGKDFPGQRLGPQPTTDRCQLQEDQRRGFRSTLEAENDGAYTFIVVTHGDDEQVVPGQTLTMLQHMPFLGLQQFGNSFLSKLEGSVVDAPFLDKINLVDTPGKCTTRPQENVCLTFNESKGVLSGEKQRVNRDYDFPAAVSWFAERADMIVVMFDAHKLDISDELTTAIATLKPHQDKIRILLNKADAVETQDLMKVYGSLMWSLGKVLHTPEVPRVYIGSFWETPLRIHGHKDLLQKEEKDLKQDLRKLPENSTVRRINELAKRARSVKVHAYIILYLQEQIGQYYIKAKGQDELIQRLDHHFDVCARRYNLARADFPQAKRFGRSLKDFGSISKITIDIEQVTEMDSIFSIHMPKLMKSVKLLFPGSVEIDEEWVRMFDKEQKVEM